MKNKCPECEGRGEFEGPTFEIEWRGRKADLPSVIPCPPCNGTGVAIGEKVSKMVGQEFTLIQPDLEKQPTLLGGTGKVEEKNEKDVP